jgi:ATPase family associated with various cellular activities (AAA)
MARDVPNAGQGISHLRPDSKPGNQSGPQEIARPFHVTSQEPRSASELLAAGSSGKTYLAKTLGEAAEATYLEFNLAECEHPGRLTEMFHEIAQFHRRTKQNKVVFFDEFDVTIAGTSMIRYLINPIYEGKYAEGQDFGAVAFIFSGSYLKSHQTLSVLQQNSSDFDFFRFLYDVYRQTPGRSDQRNHVRELMNMSSIYREGRNLVAGDRNVLDYLHRLDKLVDFLSRINGFVLEIPDISAPLEVSQALGTSLPPFLLSRPEFLTGSNDNVGDQPNFQGGKRAAHKGADLAEKILRFVTSEEKEAQDTDAPYHIREFWRFQHPTEPVLQFKNMILSERFSRVLQLLRRRIGGQSPILISRSLLGYLSVIPLVHGMRSLEYIISRLDMVPAKEESPNSVSKEVDVISGRLPPRTREDSIFQMHVHKEEQYRSEEDVWFRLGECNPRPFDQIISMGERVWISASDG